MINQGHQLKLRQTECRALINGLFLLFSNPPQIANGAAQNILDELHSDEAMVDFRRSQLIGGDSSSRETVGAGEVTMGCRVRLMNVISGVLLLLLSITLTGVSQTKKESQPRMDPVGFTDLRSLPWC
jgi:hypothetical protein